MVVACSTALPMTLSMSGLRANRSCPIQMIWPTDSKQTKPSPNQPGPLHAHEKLPGELRLVPFTSHGLVAHSSTSSQVTPSPVKPTWQVQSNEPGVSVQSASAEQLSVPVAHSSMLTQVSPDSS